MDLEGIAGRLAEHRLAPLGAFHTGPGSDEGDLPPGTLILTGPMEPGFWACFTESPEWRDGASDPLDRWSRRVIGAIAGDLGARALFPFGGPPYHPFQAWALRSGRAWESPVRLLVHDTAGLMVSYRGALLLPGRLALPPPPPKPCDACARPCVAACPVDALNGQGYDIPACHAFLDRPEGRGCMESGCAVRRACPVSQSYGRVAGQSAYHMHRFHKGTQPR